MALNMASDVHVEFYSQAQPNEAKSREQGRPVFETKEFVRIKFPGDKNRIHVAYADEPSIRDSETNEWLTYKDRFPAHYAAFKKNEQFVGDGTPIDEAPFLNKAQKEELKASNVHSIEAMANVPDGNLKNLGMQARQWKNQAQAYIARAEGSAEDGKLAAENAALKQRMADMEQQMRDLMAGGAKPADGTASPEGEQEDDFDQWSEADLRAYIKDVTGKNPGGNTSTPNLVKMARDAHKASGRE